MIVEYETRKQLLVDFILDLPPDKSIVFCELLEEKSCDSHGLCKLPNYLFRRKVQLCPRYLDRNYNIFRNFNFSLIFQGQTIYKSVIQHNELWDRSDPINIVKRCNLRKLSHALNQINFTQSQYQKDPDAFIQFWFSDYTSAFFDAYDVVKVETFIDERRATERKYPGIRDDAFIQEGFQRIAFERFGYQKWFPYNKELSIIEVDEKGLENIRNAVIQNFLHEDDFTNRVRRSECPTLFPNPVPRYLQTAGRNDGL